MTQIPEKTPDVSVIIPVYNVAPYIRECAESLLNQTLQNIEYIFIDDASTDDSLKILKDVISEYPLRQPQIKLIQHRENKGVSFTRQEGVDNATGNWIIHCDSDDFVDKNAYRTLLETAKAKDSDMVICSFSSFDRSNGSKLIFQGQGSKKSIDVIKGICGNSNEPLHGSLCNKLIKRELCNDIVFPLDVSYCEDVVYLIQILLRHPEARIDILPQSFYNYRKRKGSLISSHNEKHQKELILLINFLENIKQLDSHEFNSAIDVKILSIIFRLLNTTDNIKLYSNRYGRYKQFIPLNNDLNFFKKIFLKTALGRHYRLARIIRYLNNKGNSLIKGMKTSAY